ncbi:ORC-CDC6 family AAA ATPase [Demequina activiva]|uniref:Uncharacterized protein n=1 Tax=Demequina activiva TaxID=1582364 RepID=A0A919Q6Z1_9MICO|nr:hypothetical protein [Demequina activiva]GIG55338.1 hypothetical protein Dac01nite_20900 [Demequina activiva]
MEVNDQVEALHANFGGVRAEYLRHELFGLFTRPTYWPELLTMRPVFLIGGRGTGKTTVLRGLSYEGEAALQGEDLDRWNHVGVYWRVNTNAVSAFEQRGYDEHKWESVFGHYVNLVLAEKLARFLIWHDDRVNAGPSDRSACRATATSLGLESCSSAAALARSIHEALLDLETRINSSSALDAVTLSLPGRPLDELAAEVSALKPGGELPVYFLVDEFENLLNYQQRVINTLVKHSGDAAYTFKIGVKETGHREVGTLGNGQAISEPADFASVDIAQSLRGDAFEEFARNICQLRLNRVFDGAEAPEIRALLPGLTVDEEALQLDGEPASRRVIESLSEQGASQGLVEQVEALPVSYVLLLDYLARAEERTLVDTCSAYVGNRTKLRNAYNNHAYAMLFTLGRNKLGKKKFYCGWGTYTLLADGNIRFLLELVFEALNRHLELDNSLEDPVSPRTQTAAAHSVPERALLQLPGLAAEGAQLARLVLGLGRLFQVLAAHPEGHAPEVNQFTPTGNIEGALPLLNAGVMHIALTRFRTDKRASASGEVSDFSYQLHPIFSAYFNYSHRRKRKLKLRAGEILGLGSDPRRHLDVILKRASRSPHDTAASENTLFSEVFRAES